MVRKLSVSLHKQKRNMLCFESSGETDGLTEIQEKYFRNQESTLTMMKISEGKQNGEI